MRKYTKIIAYMFMFMFIHVAIPTVCFGAVELLFFVIFCQYQGIWQDKKCLCDSVKVQCSSKDYYLGA